MGKFSWIRADCITKRANIVEGDSYKILIPKKFGGGFIKDTYWNYGYVFHGTDHEANLYGILAYWNHCNGMKYIGNKYPSTMEEILKYGNTTLHRNQCNGVDIAYYDANVDRLKYPLKLVSASYKGTYEDCVGRSYSDPDRGYHKGYWDKSYYCNYGWYRNKIMKGGN